MGKLKAYKQYLQGKLNKGTLQTDFIITDFTVNDSVVSGYFVRDGPYEYLENGVKVIKYKDWDNLKRVYGDLKPTIAYGSKMNDSHTEANDRMIGFMSETVLVPKGTRGPAKPYVDEKFNRVFGRVNTRKDIEELSDLTEYVNMPVSMSYNDLGDGNQQVVGKVHHIAISLNANETDRCSTAGGTSCNMSLENDFTTHDQTEEVVNPTNTDDNSKVYKSVKTPPTIKKQSDAIMPKDKKKDKMKNEDKDEDEDEEKDESKDTVEIQDGQKVNRQAEGDDDEVEEKIKGDPYQQEEKLVAGKKDTVEVPAEIWKDMLDTMNDYKKEKAVKNASEAEEIADFLKSKKVPEDLLEGKSLDWLKDKKDFLEFLPQPTENDHLTHEDVNKGTYDFQVAIDPRADILKSAIGKYADFYGGKK